MSNLIYYFQEWFSSIVLVNDILPVENKMEYSIPESVERIFLDSTYKKGNKQIHRIKKLRQIIKERNADVVLSFLGSPNIRFLIASLGLKTKKIVSVRNDPYYEYGSGIRKAVTRILFDFADGVVFQTKQASEYFTNRVRDKSVVIFNPVNEVFKTIEWDCQSSNIVAVGRLEPQKNYFMLLSAFEKLSNINRNLNLIIVGDGSLRTQLEQYVNKHCLDKRVSFLGQISKVEDVLGNALLYVLTSDYEGMPNSLMEAMTAGVPCIATDCPCGGPKALLGDSLYLVRCNEDKELADRINMFIDDIGLMKAASVKMKERAKLFSTDEVMRQWINYIEIILGE